MEDCQQSEVSDQRSEDRRLETPLQKIRTTDCLTVATVHDRRFAEIRSADTGSDDGQEPSN